jgi:putative nucleotidyltransferase with HDIG domain
VTKDEKKKKAKAPESPAGETLKERLKFIESIEDIPAIPDTLMKLLAKLEEPRVKFKEVQRLIALDPALVSYILRVVNSPFLGLRTEVLTISKAITVVGIDHLKSLIIAYGIRFLYKTIKHPEIQKYLWEHAISVGVLSKIISEQVYKVIHSQIYVFGLLHDIGKIVLLMYRPDTFDEAMKMGLDKKVDGVQVEADLFGFSHIEAGYFLLSKLGFQKTMKDIVLFHHNPEYCPHDNQPVWIVSFANRLSYQMDDFENKNLKWYLEKLKLSMRQLEKIVIEGQEQLQQYLSFL